MKFPSNVFSSLSIVSAAVLTITQLALALAEDPGSNSTTTSINTSCDQILPTASNFDLDQYASAPWYIHQQAVTSYSPISDNYCVRAEYEVRSNPTFLWKYTVNVNNSAKTMEGNDRGTDGFFGTLCAYQTDLENDQPAKLAVAPCTLPKFLAGPYWVMAYDENEEGGGDGYALVSGGNPDRESYDDDGNFLGCKTRTGTNNSGLWIFSRSPVRSDELVNQVRDIATELGFDVSVLNDVSHEPRKQGLDFDCPYPVGSTESPTMSPTVTASVIPTSGGGEDEEECQDVEDTFYVLFHGRKDCEWIASGGWWSSLRCYWYSDFCPVTCGTCEE